MFGSMMSGFGGAFLMLGYSDKFVPDLIAGRGWLVVVAIIAGNWMPFRIVYVASLVLLAGLRLRTHQPVALGIPCNRD